MKYRKRTDFFFVCSWFLSCTWKEVTRQWLQFSCGRGKRALYCTQGSVTTHTHLSLPQWTRTNPMRVLLRADRSRHTDSTLHVKQTTISSTFTNVLSLDVVQLVKPKCVVKSSIYKLQQRMMIASLPVKHPGKWTGFVESFRPLSLAQYGQQGP